MDAPMDSELLMNLGKKDSSPFGCESIEADPQTGIYAGNPCGSGKLCGPYKVRKPDDNINGEERSGNNHLYRTFAIITILSDT